SARMARPVVSPVGTRPPPPWRARPETLAPVGGMVLMLVLSACTADLSGPPAPQPPSPAASSTEASPEAKPSPAGPTDGAILGARVPSLCDFPPGRLVDGVLEGTAPDGSEGGVW